MLVSIIFVISFPYSDCHYSANVADCFSRDEEFKIESISIFPPKKRAKKKKGKRKKNTNAAEAGTAIEEEPKWITFETMKEAISAGWKVRFSLL